MSEDTIKRVEAFSISDIFTPNNYLYELESLNQALRNQGSGPYINLSIETFTDIPYSTKPGIAGRQEEGVVVYQISDRVGSGKRSLYIIRDKIKSVFIDPTIPSKQKKLEPATGEDGQIVFYEISQRPAVDVGRSSSRSSWKRLDVLVSYKKYYNVT